MADSIHSFQWTGINKQGSRVKGIIQAVDAKTAELGLKNMDIEVISIVEKKRSFQFPLWRKRVRPKDIVLFTRYLATMLAAGMPILKALDVIAHDNENELMSSVVMSLRTSISSGTTFADSLNQFPQYFNELYCNLVRAGEKSATLDVVLNRLAKYLEKIQTLKSKIKTALIYPIAIITVATVVSLILLVFVIPQFQTMFQNAGVQLPFFTLMVIHLSDFVRHYWYLILIVIFLAVWTFRKLKQTNPVFADRVDAYLLRIFIVGTIIKKAIISRFTRTLAITLDAGMPIVDSMKAMIRIMGNRVYSKGIQQICDDISSGHPLSSSMEQTKLFPNMVIQMVSVGEASGEMGAMLNNIANYYEEEVNIVVDNMMTLLEPAIIVVLGVIIGCFVVAMYLPIFKLGTTI
jgi:type IV pilus assembly protein PilC